MQGKTKLNTCLPIHKVIHQERLMTLIGCLPLYEKVSFGTFFRHEQNSGKGEYFESSWPTSK